jgi:hypothetical protein
MKNALIFLAILSLLALSCTKKTTTNNYYYPAEAGKLVGFVYPPDSEAEVTVHLGIVETWVYVDTVGYFEFGELPPGTYSISVKADGYMDYQSSKPTWISGGATVSLDTIYLSSIHDLVESVHPADGTEAVRLDDRIRILFRKEMNQESVEEAFELHPELEGSFVWYDRCGVDRCPSMELHFVPEQHFVTGTVYQVKIDTLAADIDGIKLSDPCEFSFTTEPLRIAYASPSDGETWVSPFTGISIRFNTEMDAASVVSAFEMVDSELNPIAGQFSWRYQIQLDFRPQLALAGGEKYTVTVDTAAFEIGGGKLAEAYQFSFTVQPVRVLDTWPLPSENWVDPEAVVSVLFSTNMDAQSVILAFKMVDSGLNDVTGQFAFPSARQMSFTPDLALATNETYTVTIDTNAKDISGGSLENSYVFWFKTRP